MNTNEPITQGKALELMPWDEFKTMLKLLSVPDKFANNITYLMHTNAGLQNQSAHLTTIISGIMSYQKITDITLSFEFLDKNVSPKDVLDIVRTDKGDYVIKLNKEPRLKIVD